MEINTEWVESLESLENLESLEELQVLGEIGPQVHRAIRVSGPVGGLRLESVDGEEIRTPGDGYRTLMGGHHSISIHSSGRDELDIQVIAPDAP